MASGPDLFVVCKSCGSEVSPYITECPYCGTRLRKRAPKLEKGGVPKPPKQRRRPPTPSLGRLRPGEIPGIRADISRKPYATMFLVLAAVLITLGLRSGLVEAVSFVYGTSFNSEYWTLITWSFVYLSDGYQAVVLGCIALFGWLVERRHGPVVTVLVYALATAAGAALVIVLDATGGIGGNAAALGLLCAWVVPELLARRRGEETEGDLLGVAVLAAVLLALPLANDQASAVAGLGGALTGLLIGLPLARAARD